MCMTGHQKHNPVAIPTATMAAILMDAGEALYGDGWRGQLSTALGYAKTGSTLRRWLDGETPVPDIIPGRLLRLLSQVAEELSRLIAQIHAQLVEQKSQPIEGHFEIELNQLNLNNLESAGLLLFGPTWEKALATTLGYSRWGVRDWKQGKRNTPHKLPWLLMRVLSRRQWQIQAITARLTLNFPGLDVN